MGSYFSVSSNNFDAVSLGAVGSTATAQPGLESQFLHFPFILKLYFNNSEAFLAIFYMVAV